MQNWNLSSVLELIKAITVKDLAVFNIPMTASFAVGEGELAIGTYMW